MINMLYFILKTYRVERPQEIGMHYFQTLLDAAAIAATAFGDGPNVSSFAPSRTANGLPRERSISSGDTNGTIDGSPLTIGVKRGPVMKERRRILRMQDLAPCACRILRMLVEDL